MAETRTGAPSLQIPGIEDLAPLGRGGFGTVYRGWQPALRRNVAVKVLDAPATDAEAAARFRREGMAMGALSGHPNVVPVYATGTVGDRLYLVMPLLSDGSLADQLAGGPLPADEVVRLGRGLADALAAAHGAGVLHRDVKPANVLRTPYGAFQLADFGIARLADTTQTMGGSLHATVAYAAPEVLAGEPATEASDVYSLGATLHAALRGRPPYEAGQDEAPIALAVRVLSTEPPGLEGAGVPASLVAVIDRAMAREVADRYPSAAALRDALDELALDEDDAAAPTAVPLTEPLPAVAASTEPVPLTMPAPIAASGVADRPAPTRAQPRTRDRSPMVLVVLGLLVLAVGAILYAATRDDGDDQTATPGAADEVGTTAPTTEAEQDEGTAPQQPTDSTAAPESTEAPPETTEAPASDPGTSAEAVRTYYATMDAGRIDEGWSMLSPAYQDRTGERSYRAFWGSIAGVEVLAVVGDEMSADATLRYTRNDGSTSTEDVTIRLVRAEDGRLLIDDYRTV